MQNQHFFKQLTTIFYALMAGQIFFALLAHYLVGQPGYEGDRSYFQILQFIALAWLLGGGLAAQFIYRKNLQRAKQLKSIEEKAKIYTRATIIRSALLESVTLYLLIAYFITADPVFIIMGLLSIMFFLLYRPTKTRIESELNLTKKEKESLFDHKV
jgi:MFS family permease